MYEEAPGIRPGPRAGRTNETRCEGALNEALETKLDKTAFKLCFQIQLEPLQHGVQPGEPVRRGARAGQGLTLVHISAQPEPFLTLKFHGPLSVSLKRRLC
jgi:hypothetical protein